MRIHHVSYIFAICLAIGCGSSGKSLNRQAISGKVTLDGSPLASGAIRFEPFGATAGTTATGTLITNGEYAIPVASGLPPGKFTVSITASDSAGAPASSDPVQAMDAAAQAKPSAEKIPPRYNTMTELVVEVVSGKANSFDFPLTSAAKK